MSTLAPISRLEKFLAKIAGDVVSISPKTRLEKFFAKIAGDSVDVTPVTRLENFLNDVAEAGGGGGSSDFSTAEVTLQLGTLQDIYIHGAVVISQDGITATYYQVSGEGTYTVILYNGAAVVELYTNQQGSYVPNISGNATVIDGNVILVSGDCTLRLGE